MLKSLLRLAVISVSISSGSAYAEALKVGWVQGNAVYSAMPRVQSGFESYAQKNGLDWDVTYFDAGGSSEKVATGVQDLISRGVNVIVIALADLRSSGAMLKEAQKAKIPVLTVDSGQNPDAIVDITTNNYQMSSDVTLRLLGMMGGRGNLVVLSTDQHRGVRERTDTLRAILKEYPDVKIIVDHNFPMSKFYEDSQAAMQDAITRYGDEINGVWAAFDEVAKAAQTSVDDAGLKIPISGMDGQDFAKAAICQNDSNFKVTAVQDFEGWGNRLGEYVERIAVKHEDPDTVTGGAKSIYLRADALTSLNCPK